MRTALALVTVLAVALGAQVAEPVSEPAVARLRGEGLLRSQVMDHLWWLTDVHGPRLTGSPPLARASQWAMQRLGSWGLANIHQERFPFGQGWTVERFAAHLLEPQEQPLIGYPRTWSPATAGVVSGEAALVLIESAADFETYRGRLAGRIALMQPARAVPMLEGRVVLRMSDAELAEASAAALRAVPRAARNTLRARIDAFLVTEGVLAALDRGSDAVEVEGGSDLSWTTQRTDGGTIFPGAGGSRYPADARPVPSATLAVEHYNRLARLLEKGVPVRLELDIRTRFHQETDPNGITTIAEIPGTDLAHELVILGAHFDSTPAGTGATDNAAGCAAVMEAARLIVAAGLKPRRTIRIALWGGEEQGLLGARAHVRAHFGDPLTMALKPGHERVAAYFNVDNGTGRIRGVWLQGNLEAGPIFDAWMKPLADLGVTTSGPRSVGGSDHLAFDEVGLPAFQFMQDRLEYNSRTHHSNMDVYDRVQPDDLAQVATVTAVFAYHAAMRDQKLPRKRLPLARTAVSR